MWSEEEDHVIRGGRGGEKGERSGQRVSEGRVRDRGTDLPANLGISKSTG